MVDTPKFEMVSTYNPAGDQPQAIASLADGVKRGDRFQTLLGITDQVEREMQRSSRTRRNQISVMNELQADCYAGVWANHAQKMKNILEPGDIDEALNAASAIGDDRLQKETQGRVVPESFTHGTSQQRARWFRQGFQSGEMKQCDTFNTPSL